ncbi:MULTISPECIES: DUF503 domain-containing protein [unclassified Diaminobutyricimonas]|uniref:DUF503 domain-containing protein n=1 Tax=unclassified Diaminobutyricimonas TaxID=2643261 RepID=UPI0012F4CFC8|nr:MULTISPECIES: DUF503 domain-containing protein [unclassified Diaminobutyricimonas]
MWIGWIEFDLLLGDVHSLKEKRAIIRPLIAELRRRFQLAVAEAGHLDLHRRSLVGVSAVSADHAHLVLVFDEVERFVGGRQEVQVLSAGRGFARSDD